MICGSFVFCKDMRWNNGGPGRSSSAGPGHDLLSSRKLSHIPIQVQYNISSPIMIASFNCRLSVTTKPTTILSIV